MAQLPRTAAPMARTPRLVAFDLDGTLWRPEMYQMRGPPFTRNADGTLCDRAGTVCHLLGTDVLRELCTDAWAGCKIAVCSRTDEPAWAEECMRKFEVAPGLSLRTAVDVVKIHQGCKKAHFWRIRKATGIAFKDMLFFDNEARNCRAVASLGVVCVHTPDGLSAAEWARGLEEYANTGI